MKDSGNRDAVSVVGLGYVGLSMAAVLARRGSRVFGIDHREDVVNLINTGNCPIREPGLKELLRRVTVFGRLTAHTDPGVAAGAGTVIMAVGTPLDTSSRPDLGQLEQAAADIAPFLRKGQSLIIKSTVPPGTTRKLAEVLSQKSGLKAGSDFSMAFCPERLAEGSMISDLETIPVVVGGITPENTRQISSFWASMGWPVIPVSGPEEAEMTKLADNLWIDLNIALANEICMICHRINIDVLEVIGAANTLPKGAGMVNILSPGPGVGGSCLVKDPWFLHHLGNEAGVGTNLPPAGRKTNDGMPGFMAGILEEGLGRTGAVIKGAEVAVLGLAFKQKTGDTRFSPSLDLVRILASAGARVRVHDPWVDQGEAEQLLAGLAVLEDSLPSAVAGCDAVVFMVAHPEFSGTPAYWKGLVGDQCLVLDCRYIFNPAEMAGAGINYIAPGRRLLPGTGGEIKR